ncbi:MAG TPA: lactate utilization protein [Candidatus Methylomirabilis sp.]|jgi:L-lactate dehydrogenase complex protein LldG|nr:lactate utilization protein [Candidatus Methylomirabilis sp.]
MSPPPVLAERLQEVWRRAAGSAPALRARFLAAAGKMGAIVHEAGSREAALHLISELAESRGARRLVAADAALAEGLARAAPALPASDAAREPGSLLTADWGVSWSVCGVAETGSIIVHLDPPDARLTTMLPAVHAALLPDTAIVETLQDGLLVTQERILRLQQEGRPSYLSWVTGPSRTADIERVLTIGVHGPRELHILLVAGEGGP